MVFKRRTRRPIWKVIFEALWPKGGWARAFSYVKHRVRRLPDPPHRIARGIFAGVFTTFTPFYGLHFFVAGLIAFVMRGNILAALLATFFGNPLTYVPIGLISLKTGHFLLGTEFDHRVEKSLIANFRDAGQDLFNNFLAVFTDKTANWSGLNQFWHEVFFPYLVGGIIPGLIAGIIAYYLSVPVISAYQNRRKGRLKKKLAELRQKKLKPMPKPTDENRE